MNREENFKTQITKYESFEKNLPFHRDGQINALNELFIGIEPTKKILDVGCGDGIALKWLKENRYNLVAGIDGNPNKLREAELIGFSIYEGDIHDLSKIINDRFDIIYCSHVLEHMFNPDVVIEEFKKILNLNGIIIIIVPYPDHGPDDAHCGKYYLKTNYRSKNEIDIINVFKLHGLNLLWKKVTNVRQDEIYLKFNL